MNKRIRRIVEMGDRVVQMGTHPGLNPNVAIATRFADASAAVMSIKERSSDQATGSGMFRGGAQQSRIKAREIREAMLEISGIARVLKPSDLPGAREIFRMPRGNASFQSLLAAARHFAEDVRPHKAHFIARAMPATFVEDLEVKIAGFEEAVGQKSSGRATQVRGTSGLEIEAKALLEIVQELRAVLRVHLKSNPALLDAWQSAARVETNRRSTKGTEPEPVIEPETVGSNTGAGALAAPAMSSGSEVSHNGTSASDDAASHPASPTGRLSPAAAPTPAQFNAAHPASILPKQEFHFDPTFQVRSQRLVKHLSATLRKQNGPQPWLRPA